MLCASFYFFIHIAYRQVADPRAMLSFVQYHNYFYLSDELARSILVSLPEPLVRAEIFFFSAKGIKLTMHLSQSRDHYYAPDMHSGLVCSPARPSKGILCVGRRFLDPPYAPFQL